MLTVALFVAAWLLIAFVVALVIGHTAALGDEQITRTNRDPRGPP